MANFDSFTIRRKLKRHIFFVSLALVISVLVIVLILVFKEKIDWASLFFQTLTSLLIALLTIFVIDYLYKRVTQDGHDDHIQRIILDLLSVKESEVIGGYYDKEQLKKIIYNCIHVICDKFSNDIYTNIVESNMDRFREDFIYIVEVSENTVDEKTESYILGEELVYTKYIRINPREGQFIFKCFFAFDDKTLNEAFDNKEFNDGTFFFRGILKNKLLIDKIKVSSQEEVIKYLDFEIYIMKNYEDKVGKLINTKDIDVKIQDNGIMIKSNIPSEYMSYAKNYTNYRAKIKCQYPISENSFYCVFSEPTVSTNTETKFQIIFPSFIKKEPERIKYLSLLSCANDTLMHEVKTNSWVFLTKKTIFPRSGFVINW